MNVTLPVLMTYEQVTAWTGWSRRTILRKVDQNCFPCYRFSKTDVRFNANEIQHYIDGKRVGGFDENESRTDVIPERKAHALQANP